MGTFNISADKYQELLGTCILNSMGMITTRKELRRKIYQFLRFVGFSSKEAREYKDKSVMTIKRELMKRGYY